MDSYEGLTHAFVRLADTLVADFDVVELAQQLVDNAIALLPVDAAGIVLADSEDQFRVLATNNEQNRLLQLFQIQRDDGPCLLCYRTGEPVIVEDLRADLQRWPEFTAAAIDSGYLSVHACRCACAPTR